MFLREGVGHRLRSPTVYVNDVQSYDLALLGNKAKASALNVLQRNEMFSELQYLECTVRLFRLTVLLYD